MGAKFSGELIVIVNDNYHRYCSNELLRSKQALQLLLTYRDYVKLHTKAKRTESSWYHHYEIFSHSPPHSVKVTMKTLKSSIATKKPMKIFFLV